MQGPFHAEARGPRPAEHNLTWAPSLSHAAACSGLRERRPDRRSPGLVRVGSPAQRAKRGPVLRTGLPGQTRPSQPGRTTRSSPVTWEGSNACRTTERITANQPPPNQPARFSPTLSVCSYKDAHGAQSLGGNGDPLGHLHVYSHQLGCLFTGSQLCFFPNPLLTIITKFN